MNLEQRIAELEKEIEKLKGTKDVQRVTAWHEVRAYIDGIIKPLEETARDKNDYSRIKILFGVDTAILTVIKFKLGLRMVQHLQHDQVQQAIDIAKEMIIFAGIEAEKEQKEIA